MEPKLSFDVQWLPPFSGPGEVATTSAALSLKVGTELVTRVEDTWSQSVQQQIRVSLYPLALWLAQSWWRIRWEPAPARISIPAAPELENADWRMSHEMTAAGGGFIWPRLSLFGDGEAITVRCRPSPALSQEPVKYLADFETAISSADFENKVDAFMDLVLRRLDSLGETDLHLLWSEVMAERQDPIQSALRRLEACLGYDPDEAPATLLKRFADLGTLAGQAAADEIAPVCSGEDPEAQLNRILAFSKDPGISGAFSFPHVTRAARRHAQPWERAKALANGLRSASGMGRGPLSDEDLASALGIDPQALGRPSRDQSKPPLGLAIRTNGDNFTLLLRKKNRAGRRFEAARCIGDFLSSEEDRWHPVADTGTARQKLQRAFAAEFLCPIDGLTDYLGKEFSAEAIEDAAEYFGISEIAIQSHLANHDLIPRSLVQAPVLG